MLPQAQHLAAISICGLRMRLVEAAMKFVAAFLAFLDETGMHGGHLTAWSDSCAGQNKNFFTVCLWQLLIQQGRFSIIDHKFPEANDMGE